MARLVQLLTIDGWRSVDGQVNYAAAGSFVCFLLDSTSMAPMRTVLARSTTQDSPGVIAANVESVYGRSLNDLESAWLAMLDARGR